MPLALGSPDLSRRFRADGASRAESELFSFFFLIPGDVVAETAGMLPSGLEVILFRRNPTPVAKSLDRAKRRQEDPDRFVLNIDMPFNILMSEAIVSLAIWKISVLVPPASFC